MCAPPPGIENKVMHASFRIGSTEVCATDGYANGQPKFEGISLSLTVEDVASSERAFNALADGGKVEMPLAPTFFSPSFGMLNDRFGVRWMVYVAPQNQPGAKSPA